MVNSYQNHIELEISCAEPLELVVMLYTGLLGSIRDARRQLAADDIAGRQRSVSKALAIVGELTSALDLDRGGEMAARLHQLYSFIADRLVDGSYRQMDQPLAEAEAVATTLLEAWTAIRPTATTAAAMPVHAGVAAFAGTASLSVRG